MPRHGHPNPEEIARLPSSLASVYDGGTHVPPDFT
jgi:hypothetical protein